MKFSTHNQLKLELDALNDFEFRGLQDEAEIQPAEQTLAVSLPESFKHI